MICLTIIDRQGSDSTDFSVPGEKEISPFIQKTIKETKNAGGIIIGIREIHKPGILMNFATNFIGKNGFDIVQDSSSILTYEEVRHWTETKNQLTSRAKFSVSSLQNTLKKEGHLTLWSEHSLKGTKEVEYSGFEASILDADIIKGEGNIEQYSGFLGREKLTGETLADILKRFRISTHKIVGNYTEWCVLPTALDSVKLGFTTQLLTHGIIALHNDEGKKAISQMQHNGVEIID